MAGLAHDVLVQTLRDNPLILGAILAKLMGRRMPGRLKPIDSTVRFTRPAEARPDIVYRSGRSWLVCEVQNEIDVRKRRRWLLVAGILHDATGHMGEVLVITASRAVARWAHKVAHVTGPVGTSLRLSPVVLLLDARRASALLDPRRPELALCAAWAMQKRHGPAARRIVDRAIDLSSHLPLRLREQQQRAILDILSARMRAQLEKVAMRPDLAPLKPATRKFILALEKIGAKKARPEALAEGEIEGKRSSLLIVLEGRGLSLTSAQRARIQACSSAARLDAWLKRVVTVKSVAELLGPKPAAKAAAKRRPVSRSTTPTSKTRARAANNTRPRASKSRSKS